MPADSIAYDSRRMKAGRPCALLCLALAAALTSSAGFTKTSWAQSTPSLSLTWDAPPECPSSANVLAETERLLGGPASPRNPGGLTVHARVAHEGNWSVSLEARSGSTLRTRNLRAQTCRGLSDATALILALMIDPEAVAIRRLLPAAPDEATEGAAPVPVPAPAPTPTPTPTPASPESAPPGPSAPASRRLGVSLGVPFSIESGSLPELEYGVGANVALRIDSVRFELSITYWLRTAVARVAEPPGVGGTFNLVSGALFGCYQWRWHAFEFGPCAELDAGRIEANGLAVSHPARAYPLWLAVGGGALGAVRLDDRWVIPLHLDLLVPLDRRDFMVQNVTGAIYQTASLAERLAMGLEYRF